MLLSPACPIPAPLIAESDPLPMTGVLAHFTSVWVLAGCPRWWCRSASWTACPWRCSSIGRHFDEAKLLRVAHAYQRATDWHLRRPPAPA